MIVEIEEVIELAGKKRVLGGRPETEINWDGVMLGWAVAFGVGLILISPVTGLFLMIDELGIHQTARILWWVGASGVTFLAFLYGGYVSGSSAQSVQHSSLKQGLLVPLLNLSVAVSVSLFALTSGACITLARALLGTASPGTWQVGGLAISSPGIPISHIAILLLLSLLAGALGGIWGARAVPRKRREARYRERKLLETMRAK